ncbi:MAG: DUF1972 domain-containing protein, partial [Bdellovibrionales bacterium]|nr:DUF1972 domain-containing protein [Bdellovibrionales bacterium]
MTNSKPLSIALLGTRGIPARYGGFETFAEKLACRLVNRGHEVTVYCRKAFFQPSPHARSYQGVRLKTTSTIMHKYAETPLHALTSFLSLFLWRPDVVLLCNAANSPFAFIVRLLGIPLIINVDGIERKRSKWNQLGKLWYRLGEYTSVLFGTKIVSDAHVIAEYYRDTYRCPSTVIRYGADVTSIPPGGTLAKFNLRPQSYLLYVSRLEPENNALGVIDAYTGLDTEMPLVIVGDAPYSDEYKARLRERANDRVIFAGYQFESAYFELR